jgi:hypothetical protein
MCVYCDYITDVHQVMTGVERGQSYALAVIDELDFRGKLDPMMLEFFTPMCVVFTC